MRNGRCAALLAAATLALCAAASARAADLVIAMPHLVSGHAMANVLKVAIEERFGLDAEVRELGTLTAFAALDAGEVDIIPEVWRPNLDLQIRRYEAESGTVVVALKGVPAWQGLCATPAAADRLGITDVSDLSDAAKTAELDTDGDGRGEIWIGSRNWSSTPIERVRAMSYGYADTLTLVEAEEEVGMAAVDIAVATDRPMVFVCRAPHYIYKLHNITRLKEPDFDRSKWNIVPAGEDPLWIAHSQAPVAWNVSHFHIAYASALADKHADVAAFLENVDFRPAELIAMIYALEVDRQPELDFARSWVEQNRKRVDEWMPK